MESTDTWGANTNGASGELPSLVFGYDVEQRQKLEELIAAAEIVEANGAKGGGLPLLSPGWSDVRPSAASSRRLPHHVQPIPLLGVSRSTQDGKDGAKHASPQETPPALTELCSFLPPGQAGHTAMCYTIRACALDPTAIHEGVKVHLDGASDGASIPTLLCGSPRRGLKRSHLEGECLLADQSGSPSQEPCETTAIPPDTGEAATGGVLGFLINPISTGPLPDPSTTVYAPVSVKISSESNEAQPSTALLLMPQPQKNLGVPLPISIPLTPPYIL